MTTKILIGLLVSLAFMSAIASAQGQTAPAYYDVTNPNAFPGFVPAKCDGATDDTAAFQSAINRASTTGATIEVPIGKICEIAGTLNFQNTHGVCLVGDIGASTFPWGTLWAPRLEFSATSGPLITFGGSVGFCLKDLYLRYTGSSFSGVFIEGHSSGLAAMATFQNLLIGGAGWNLNQASCLISLASTYSSVIDSIDFNNAQVGVCGASSSVGSWNNTVRNSMFNIGDNITNAGILNASDSWTIGPNNLFSLDQTAGNVVALSIQNGVSCQALNFLGNALQWGGSNPVNVLSLAGCLITVRGNTFSASSGSVAISMQSGYLVADGNAFSTLIPFSLGPGVISQIGVNDYAGTSPGPISTMGGAGRYTDLHTTTFYGGGGGNPALDVVGNLVVNGAATFNGNLSVYGTLYKHNSAFRIDHPLDPDHKYLQHSVIESPDMKNIYDGVVALDAKGEAIVRMPAYFEALNRDFRYQLTCIGGFAPVYVSRGIHKNKFWIAGGKPGLRVSWMVTGIRHDAYANAHRIAVEEDKTNLQQGPDSRAAEPGQSLAAGHGLRPHASSQQEK
jgi:hypothetical protein